MHAPQATTDDGAENAPDVDACLPAAFGAVEAVQATLACWQQQGAHRADPVRFAVLEAMARRAANHGGAARHAVEARLQALASAYQALLQAPSLPPAADGPAAPPASTVPGTDSEVPQRVNASAPRGALGVLVDALVRTPGAVPPAVSAAPTAVSPPARTRVRAPTRAARTAGSAAQGAKPAIPTLPAVDLATATLHSTAAPAAPQELLSVRRFRGTWSRLSADERLRQTLAQVPPQAGPLNALHLLHRALVQMRDISPDYLQHFVEHVDALLWLEQVQAAATPAAGARTSARPNARAIAKKQAAARKR